MPKLKEFLKYANIIEGEINYVTDSHGVRAMDLAKLIKVIQIQDDALQWIMSDENTNVKAAILANEAEQKIEKLLD